MPELASTQSREWIGLTKAGRILEMSNGVASRVLQQYGASSRQLAPGERYRGRVQYRESEVRRIAEGLNGS